MNLLVRPPRLPAAAPPTSDGVAFGPPEPASATQRETLELLILLLPGFSHLSLASVLEPLRCANEVAGREFFRWRLAGRGAGPVPSASGVAVCAATSFANEKSRLFGRPVPKAVFLCAGLEAETRGAAELHGLLRACARQGIPLCGLGGGTWVLAESGLLTDAKCTIHWKQMAALSEAHGDLEISDALYVTDGRITSCAGEFAAFDLVLGMVQDLCGPKVAQDVCRLLMADRWRDGQSRQAVPLGLKPGCTSEKLMRAIRLMERTLDSPLSMRAIARETGVSPRQIERLFERYLATTPRRYYLSLRLERARQLILQTALPITTIALSCGFEAASHFSKCFRERYGLPPNRLRG